MNKNVHQYLISKPELLHFVRMNPIWYRRLTRKPKEIELLPIAAKPFYGKTFYHRVGKINDNINLMSMLLSMVDLMNEKN